ncbi:ABC transporter substrate-binding protein [Diplocloster hominis]|uniref:ABC transporter substrate-binding protein n=1 Tax=Diplocloster hominis TaxID=3079010 RepID=UPI0031BA7115
MKRIVSFILIAIMTFTLVACGRQEEPAAGDTAQPVDTAAAEGDKDTAASTPTGAEADTAKAAVAEHVNLALSSDPGSLAPWEPSSDGRKMYAEIYETLFNYTSFGGDFVGIIGKSYEQLDDFTYRVYLYDYVKDSDGSAITSADVVWSYEQCIAGGGYNNRVKDILDVEAVDDYTLDFTYAQVLDYASFCESMMIYIVDKETFESIGEEKYALHPVATGPYLVDDYTTGSFYNLTKNENYWQTEDKRSVIQQQNCNSITYKVINETAQLAIALETGEVDMVAGIDSDNIGYFYDTSSQAALDGWFVQSELSVPCYSLVLNCSDKSVLKDQNLRLAILYAIDNEALLATAVNGEGKVEYTDGGQQYSGFQQAMADAAAENCYSCDLSKSAEYLKAAGYESGELKISLMCANFTQNVAVILQSQLLAAGINAEIKAYEPALYETYCTQDDQWDMVLAFKGKSSGLLTDYWAHFLATNSYGQANMINDEKLASLYANSLSQDATDEDILACHNYFTEMGYFYGLFNNQEYIVGKAGVTNFVTSGQYGIIPGACSYSSEFNQ